MGKDKPNTKLLFDEMNLYYEEVRDVNERTITYLKILGVIILSLATYMTFGIQSSIAEQFISAKTKHINETTTAVGCYAVLGLGLNSNQKSSIK